MPFLNKRERERDNKEQSEIYTHAEEKNHCCRPKKGFFGIGVFLTPATMGTSEPAQWAQKASEVSE